MDRPQWDSIDTVLLDLDGTLLDGRGRVSDANRRAVDRLRASGWTLVPATGRSWREARRTLQAQISDSGADPSLKSLIEPFHPDRYNTNATMAENLLFGTPIDPALKFVACAPITPRSTPPYRPSKIWPNRSMRKLYPWSQ